MVGLLFLGTGSGIRTAIFYLSKPLFYVPQWLIFTMFFITVSSFIEGIYLY